MKNCLCWAFLLAIALYRKLERLLIFLFSFLLSLALIKICPVYPIGHSILCVLLGCPLIKALNVQKPWAFFFAICLIATSLCYVGNGNSLFSSYIQISVLSNGKIHHREEFFTKNGDKGPLNSSYVWWCICGNSNYNFRQFIIRHSGLENKNFDKLNKFN